MTFTRMDSIGMKNIFILIWITIRTESYKSTILKLVTGKGLKFIIGPTLGSIPKIKVLLLIQNSF